MMQLDRSSSGNWQFQAERETDWGAGEGETGPPPARLFKCAEGWAVRPPDKGDELVGLSQKLCAGGGDQERRGTKAAAFRKGDDVGERPFAGTERPDLRVGVLLRRCEMGNGDQCSVVPDDAPLLTGAVEAKRRADLLVFMLGKERAVGNRNGFIDKIGPFSDRCGRSAGHDPVDVV